jgi:DNA excision repair protein ERCC-3
MDRNNAPVCERVSPLRACSTTHNWGLIIYDEVHLLPAPVFSITAELQARRRLGLTATLVREDGRQEDVFSLIGPKKYDVPWKDLERQGWIATADVVEVRIPLPDDLRMEYATADERQKYRIAAENPDKYKVLDQLLHQASQRPGADHWHVSGAAGKGRPALQSFPLITGKTSVKQRRQLYQQFRNGEISTLIISKVGNFAVDLPNANVMVQISGMFGSRQEEAQRLGRILRPKHDDQMAHFYTLVTKDTVDQMYGANRQLFLTEQGYQYTFSTTTRWPGQPHRADGNPLFHTERLEKGRGNAGAGLRPSACRRHPARARLG